MKGKRLAGNFHQHDLGDLSKKGCVRSALHHFHDELQSLSKKWRGSLTPSAHQSTDYDALQDQKDKVTHKHLCKKFLECSINEIELFIS